MALNVKRKRGSERLKLMKVALNDKNDFEC